MVLADGSDARNKQRMGFLTRFRAIEKRQARRKEIRRILCCPQAYARLGYECSLSAAIGGSERSEPGYFLFRYADEFEYAGSNVNNGPSEKW